MKNKYYVIAEKDDEQPLIAHSNQWPKLIAFSFETMSLLFILGRGHGLRGGLEPLSSFDSRIWDDMFKETNSNWFLHLIDNGSLTKEGAETDLINMLANKGNVRTMDY
jgi:hypothetical protein